MRDPEHEPRAERGPAPGDRPGGGEPRSAGYLCGAYAAEPPRLADEPSAEDGWYAALRDEPLIGGLELPYRPGPGLHPRGIGRLAALLDRSWACVVTGIPGTDASARADPGYGLASDQPDGRRRALDDARALHDEVAALRRLADDRIVRAVEFHSAPRTRGGHSSADRFAESLAEIASWGWGTVRLCVEHVDADAGWGEPEKGFLPLDEETGAVVAASRESGLGILQSVNWGRSAIEARSASGPVDHVSALRDAGTLGGIVFSGAAAETGPAGRAWQDAHLGLGCVSEPDPSASTPVHRSGRHTLEDPGSLLTPAGIADTLDAAGPGTLVFLGVKMRAPSSVGSDPDIARRLAPSLAGLRSLERVRLAAGVPPAPGRH